MRVAQQQEVPINSAPASASPSRTYVLVHGAWFGGWVWKETAHALRAMGHTVYAPSLTGLGDRRHLLRQGIDLTTHAEDIINLIELEQLNDVVLVGWSYGGMVISEVLARIPDKIGAMIYLDAFVPERGRSAMDYTMALTTTAASTPEQREAAGEYAATLDDLEPSSFEIMGITDPAIIATLTPKMSKHPIGTFMQASNALPERPAHIPHLFVLATASPTANLFGPVMERVRLEPSFKTMTVHTSHLLMVTAPDEILRILATV